jgi:outer membrane protein OmpA-like peptidoglycan-associated protein/uncharacterized protein YidB (DUF937 family)
MGVLDAVLNEARSQLGISSSSASSVLAGLLSFINQDEGGLSGFLNRFRQAGAGNLVTSWLGGDARPVTAVAVENAMGHDVVWQIASKAGLTTSAAASAIALMLPRLVQRLAPGGAIPTRLPSEVASYMTGAMAAMASGARQAVYAAETMAGPAAAGVARYLWPLLGLLFIAGLIVWLLTRAPGGGVTFNMEEQLRLASQKAAAALSALEPGFSAQELVSAVNLQVINFATGSTQVPADSYDFLNKAAVALKAAPAGTQIDIGGHTDNTGTPATNIQLSRQRAAAVRDYLVQQGVSAGMLTATGYGETKPIASNDTEEGRFRNRRIEFSVK